MSDFGDAHRPSNDEVIWRVRRFRKNHPGSENVYFATEDAAYNTAKKAEKDGSLIFFAEYKLKKRIYLNQPRLGRPPKD